MSVKQHAWAGVHALSERGRKQRIIVAAVLLGFASLVIIMGLFWLSARSDDSAYHSATACPAAPGPTCEAQESVVVKSATTQGVKGVTYWLDLEGLGPNGSDLNVEMWDEGGVWDAVHSGDTVSVAVWRGEVVSVTAGPITTVTDDNPMVREGHDLGAFLGACCALVVVLFWLAFQLFPSFIRTGKFVAGWTILGFGLAGGIAWQFLSLPWWAIEVYAALCALFFACVAYDRSWERKHGDQRPS